MEASRPGSEHTRAGLGRVGEEATLGRYLRDGYREVARNWRCPIGEIDLVLGRRGELVFCEVKTRRGDALGPPFEAVTPRKQRRVRRLAEAFLSSRPGIVEQIRFDVASVTIGPRGEAHVHVFEDAF